MKSKTSENGIGDWDLNSEIKRTCIYKIKRECEKSFAKMTERLLIWFDLYFIWQCFVGDWRRERRRGSGGEWRRLKKAESTRPFRSRWAMVARAAANQQILITQPHHRPRLFHLFIYSCIFKPPSFFSLFYMHISDFEGWKKSKGGPICTEKPIIRFLFSLSLYVNASKKIISF